MRVGIASDRCPWRWPGRRALRAIVVIGFAVGVLTGLPLASSRAVEGDPAPADAAQVRIFVNGEFEGGGTLVDRNWALTVAHIFDRPDNPSIHSLRFGVTDFTHDTGDTAHRRAIDRIVLAPRGDVALVHFAEAVPEDTWIPELAEQPPTRGEMARLYGWGPDGTTLRRGVAIVYDPVATANAAHERERWPDLAWAFPQGADPMVTSAVTAPGDSGAGVFTDPGVLTGIHFVSGDYQAVNNTGTFIGELFDAAYEQPVWSHRQWILDTINGAGPSHDELRRKLLDTTSGPPPMSDPPDPGTCNDERSCSEPTWVLATLTATNDCGGQPLCMLPAACPAGDGNACTFEGSTYTTGPVEIPVDTDREVEVWCRTTNTLTSGGSPQDVVRLSFTNADRTDVAVGMGWWDVDPSGVKTGSNPINTTSLPTC